jgi:hypothetical protein
VLLSSPGEALACDLGCGGSRAGRATLGVVAPEALEVAFPSGTLRAVLAR